MFANALSRLSKFAKKSYRDGYMQSRVRMSIAYQVQALRKKFSLTQVEFADKTGKKQSVISRLENTEYGKASVQTLLDIASANDVALVVRFVSYPEFFQQMEQVSESALQPQTIYESLASPPPLKPVSVWNETRKKDDYSAATLNMRVGPSFQRVSQ